MAYARFIIVTLGGCIAYNSLLAAVSADFWPTVLGSAGFGIALGSLKWGD